MIVVSCLMSTTNAFVAPQGQTLSTGTSSAPLVQKQSSSWAQTSTTSSSTTSLGFNRKPSTNEYDKSLKDASLEADLKEQIRFFDPFPKQNDLPILQDEDNEDDEQAIGIWAARGLLLAVAMLWGTNFASVKYLETLCFHPPCNHPPSEAALARFGIAAIASLPVLIGKRFDIILAGLECGLWVTLGYVTQAEALRYIDSGTCAFICSLTVVVVPLFERIFGKPLKKSSIASAVVALSGVAVLEGMVDVTSLLHIEPAMADTAATTATTIVPGITEAATTTTTASAAATTGWIGSLASTLGVSKGDIIALGQPIGFGFSFLRIEQYVEKFKDEKDRVLTIAAAECVAVGLCALLWVLVDFHGTIPNMEYMVSPMDSGDGVVLVEDDNIDDAVVCRGVIDTAWCVCDTMSSRRSLFVS